MFRNSTRYLLGGLYLIGLPYILVYTLEAFNLFGGEKFSIAWLISILPSSIADGLIILTGALPGLNLTFAKFSDFELWNKVQSIINLALYISIWFVIDGVIRKLKARNCGWFIISLIIFMILSAGFSFYVGLVRIAQSTDSKIFATTPIVVILSLVIYILTFSFVLFWYWRAKIDARQAPQNP